MFLVISGGMKLWLEIIMSMLFIHNFKKWPQKQMYIIRLFHTTIGKFIAY